jgi:hypothetical protein
MYVQPPGRLELPRAAPTKGRKRRHGWRRKQPEAARNVRTGGEDVEGSSLLGRNSLQDRAVIKVSKAEYKYLVRTTYPAALR